MYYFDITSTVYQSRPLTAEEIKKKEENQNKNNKPGDPFKPYSGGKFFVLIDLIEMEKDLDGNTTEILKKTKVISHELIPVGENKRLKVKCGSVGGNMFLHVVKDLGDGKAKK